MDSLIVGALATMGILAIIAFGVFLVANHFITRGGKRKSSLLSITVAALVSALLIFFMFNYFLYG